MSKFIASHSTGQQPVSNHRLEDAALRGLPTVFDPGVVASLLREAYIGDGSISVESAEVAYIRYKPATSCLAAYRVVVRRVDSTENPAETVWFYAKCYREDAYPAAMSKAAVRDLTDRNYNWKTLALPEINCVLYPVELDTELRGLPTIFDARKNVRMIHSALPEYARGIWRISDRKLRLTTIRYKPEKRAVFRAETRLVHRATGERQKLSVYIRAYSEEHDPNVLSLMRNLYQMTAGTPYLRIPEPLLYVEDKRLLFVREVAGTPYLELLNQHSAEALLPKIALALWHFHGCAGVPAPHRTTAGVLADAITAAQSLVQIYPDLSESVKKITGRLRTPHAALPSAAQGLVHGDLHPGQILLGDQSAPVTFLDFDRTCRGDVVLDIGNFIAHLHLAKLQGGNLDVDRMARTFQAAYEDASASAIDSRLLRFWTVLGLLQLAISPFRTLRSNWRQGCRAIIEKCGELL